MANAFGFTTKTDYSDVTAARQRQTAQTALQLKDAMKNVSSTIIEKRIAKKYDDPYSIEAMKERQVSYAGIDPTRSEQARKYINDAMTQQRLDLDQEYKQRAEDRAVQSAANTEAYRKSNLELQKQRFEESKSQYTDKKDREQVERYFNFAAKYDPDKHYDVSTPEEFVQKYYPPVFKNYQKVLSKNSSSLDTDVSANANQVTIAPNFMKTVPYQGRGAFEGVAEKNLTKEDYIADRNSLEAGIARLPENYPRQIQNNINELENKKQQALANPPRTIKEARKLLGIKTHAEFNKKVGPFQPNGQPIERYFNKLIQEEKAKISSENLQLNIKKAEDKLRADLRSVYKGVLNTPKNKTNAVKESESNSLDRLVRGS